VRTVPTSHQVDAVAGFSVSKFTRRPWASNTSARSWNRSRSSWVVRSPAG
jgi:hypothetical protein